MLDHSKNLFPYMREIRRTIHQHPELSFCEVNTCRLIAEQLKKEGIPYQIVSKTGILARIDSGEPSAQPVVLRADMDALPITERTPVEYASKNGAMHACGHDIHTASLLGALVILNRNKDLFRGTILGLFQPGEERWPGGASLVIKEGIFEEFDPKAFVALHVAPEICCGQFGFREGKYMASSDEIKMTIHGTGGHGALPDICTDSVLASANIIMSLQQIVSRNNKPITPSVLSIGKVIAEGATNIIPKEVRIEGTFRTMDELWRRLAKERIREVIQGMCAAYCVEADIEMTDGYPCVYNDEKITRFCREEITRMVGMENVHSLDLRMTSEDFGYYSQCYPSMMFRLGVGRSDDQPTGALHSDMFNPDEESLVYGAASMATLGAKLSFM